MRLTCPNCAARYEIDGALIPARGRDMQCSACGHTWFERAQATQDAPPPTSRAVGKAAAEDIEAGAGRGTPSSAVLPGDDIGQDTPPPSPGPASDQRQNPDMGPDPDENDEAPAPRRIAPAAQAILREEAERAERQRRGQPVDDIRFGPSGRDAARNDLAFGPADDTDAPGGGAAGVAPRRGPVGERRATGGRTARSAEAVDAFGRPDRLPDADAITSTLTPAMRDDPAPEGRGPARDRDTRGDWRDAPEDAADPRLRSWRSRRGGDGYGDGRSQDAGNSDYQSGRRRRRRRRQEAPRSGWTGRFLTALLLVAAFCVGAYVWEGRIVAALPEAEVAMQRYIDAVDRLRDGVEFWIGRAGDAVLRLRDAIDR